MLYFIFLSMLITLTSCHLSSSNKVYVLDGKLEMKCESFEQKGCGTLSECQVPNSDIRFSVRCPINVFEIIK